MTFVTCRSRQRFRAGMNFAASFLCFLSLYNAGLINGKCPDYSTDLLCSSCENKTAECRNRCIGNSTHPKDYMNHLCAGLESDLEIVDVSLNSLTIFECPTFSSKVKHLNASNNKLRFDNCSNWESHCHHFFRRVKTIDLSYNNIQQTCNASAFSFVKLINVNLSHNNITSLDNLPFVTSATRLETLDLSHNKITRIPGTFLMEKKDLCNVDLRFNNIHVINLHFDVCDGRIKDLNRSVDIDVRGNNVSSIQIHVANNSACSNYSSTDLLKNTTAVPCDRSTVNTSHHEDWIPSINGTRFRVLKAFNFRININESHMIHTFKGSRAWIASNVSVEIFCMIVRSRLPQLKMNTVSETTINVNDFQTSTILTTYQSSKIGPTEIAAIIIAVLIIFLLFVIVLQLATTRVITSRLIDMQRHNSKFTSSNSPQTCSHSGKSSIANDRHCQNGTPCEEYSEIPFETSDDLRARVSPLTVETRSTSSDANFRKGAEIGSSVNIGILNRPVAPNCLLNLKMNHSTVPADSIDHQPSLIAAEALTAPLLNLKGKHNSRSPREAELPYMEVCDDSDSIDRLSQDHSQREFLPLKDGISKKVEIFSSAVTADVVRQQRMPPADEGHTPSLDTGYSSKISTDVELPYMEVFEDDDRLEHLSPDFIEKNPCYSTSSILEEIETRKSVEVDDLENQRRSVLDADEHISPLNNHMSELSTDGQVPCTALQLANSYESIENEEYYYTIVKEDEHGLNEAPGNGPATESNLHSNTKTCLTRPITETAGKLNKSLESGRFDEDLSFAQNLQRNPCYGHREDIDVTPVIAESVSMNSLNLHYAKIDEDVVEGDQTETPYEDPLDPVIK